MIQQAVEIRKFLSLNPISDKSRVRYDRREAVLFKDLWSQTDQFLVEQCLAGNSRAWACLVNRYKRLIYHFPSSERLSPEDCDDVFQETLTALYRQLDKINQVEDLSFWISKVAQRQTWRAVNRSLKYMELTETYDVAAPEEIPEKEMELKVQQSKVRQGLAQLNDKCRVLLTRLFMETNDSDYKKISEELGIAMGSIGPTRNRCLVKFKKILWKLGITEKNVSKWLD